MKLLSLSSNHSLRAQTKNETENETAEMPMNRSKVILDRFLSSASSRSQSLVLKNQPLLIVKNTKSSSSVVVAKTATKSFHAQSKASSFASKSEPEYIHAKEMYSIRDVGSPKIVYGLAVVAVVGTGVAIPVFAINFQQGKR